jgi:hypothetical protein
MPFDSLVKNLCAGKELVGSSHIEGGWIWDLFYKLYEKQKP